uniref:Immunity protein n=1 Tax=Siphoviridae sp. ctwHj1 TaxID=2825727 RepID=A0A8S5U607_9CAUD|nr:MAG TPA: immunity protein [Siphoviridae sp. ctwHj1]
MQRIFPHTTCIAFALDITISKRSDSYLNIEAPHAPPSPGGAFHTPNRGPRIRITLDDMTKWEWAFYVTVIVFFVWVTWLAR